MAVPPAMMVKALSLAADPKVQKGALLAFEWLRRRTGKPEQPRGTGPSVENLIAELPTRDDLALALAQIQARIDAGEKRQRRLLIGALAVQAAVIGAVVALT